MAKNTYIDGELLLEKLSDLKFANANEAHRIEFETIDKIMRMVLAMPTADVQPVVRCRDCKYVIKEDDYTLLCNGRGWPISPAPPDDYCSIGTRGEING